MIIIRTKNGYWQEDAEGTWHPIDESSISYGEALEAPAPDTALAMRRKYSTALELAVDPIYGPAPEADAVRARYGRAWIAMAAHERFRQAVLDCEFV